MHRLRIVVVTAILMGVLFQTSELEAKPQLVPVKRGAKPVSPLESFKAIVAKYTAFYGKAPRILDGQSLKISPTGRTFTIEKPVAPQVSYDVQKTDSLVSPFTAYIVVESPFYSTDECGDVVTSNGDDSSYWGYSTRDAAIKSSRDGNCWRVAYGGEPIKFHFSYAFQDEKWVYKSHYRMMPGNSDRLLVPLLGAAASGDTTAIDPENMHWVTFFRSVI